MPSCGDGAASREVATVRRPEKGFPIGRVFPVATVAPAEEPCCARSSAHIAVIVTTTIAVRRRRIVMLILLQEARSGWAALLFVVDERRRGHEPLVHHVRREYLELRSVSNHENGAVGAGDVDTTVCTNRRRVNVREIVESLDAVLRRARFRVEYRQEAVVALQEIDEPAEEKRRGRIRSVPIEGPRNGIRPGDVATRLGQTHSLEAAAIEPAGGNDNPIVMHRRGNRERR
jgi:hypothetical protein